MRRNNSGFTLIELLLVIAIIFLILMLTVPALMTVRRKALILSCRNNMHQIHLMIEMYRQQNGEIIPYLFYASEGMLDPVHMKDPQTNIPGLAAIVRAYEHEGFSQEILKCPADTGYGGVDYRLTSTGLTCYACFGQSYAYNNRPYTDPDSPYGGGPVRFQDVEKSAHPVILLSDFSSVWHGVLGRGEEDSKYYLNVLYFDGSVKGKEFTSVDDAEKFRNRFSSWWEDSD